MIEHAIRLLPRVKSVVVVDNDIDIQDRREIAFALATRLQPDTDIVILPNTGSYPLDPSSRTTHDGYAGSKVGYDATKPLADNEKYAKVRMPETVDRKVERVLERYLGG